MFRGYCLRATWKSPVPSFDNYLSAIVVCAWWDCGSWQRVISVSNFFSCSFDSLILKAPLLHTSLNVEIFVTLLAAVERIIFNAVENTTNFYSFNFSTESLAAVSFSAFTRLYILMQIRATSSSNGIELSRISSTRFWLRMTSHSLARAPFIATVPLPLCHPRLYQIILRIFRIHCRCTGKPEEKDSNKRNINWIRPYILSFTERIGWWFFFPRT